MKLAYFFLLLLVSTAVSVKAHHKYTNPTGTEFPILAWYSIRPDSAITTERYLEMREAGFNISFSHFASRKEVEKALNASKGTGVKIMITCGDLESSTSEVVNLFKEHPSTVGWFLRDEPTTEGFAMLKEFKDRIWDSDTTHLLYLNLLPIYVNPKALGTTTYKEYIQRFIQDIDLGFFSYDNYPVVVHNNDTILRSDFYANLEDAWAVSQETGEPFWAFGLTTAHDPYPVATKEMLRLQIFSNLAYGAQGIQYFTYWNPGNTGTWNFHTAPISLDGARTHVWYIVRELNKEIHALTNIFLGAKVTDVAHTGTSIPNATHTLKQLPEGIQSIESDGEGVLVSQFENNGKKYLMVVNRSLLNSQNVTISKRAIVKRILPFDKPIKDKRKVAKIHLQPGDYILYQL